MPRQHCRGQSMPRGKRQSRTIQSVKQGSEKCFLPSTPHECPLTLDFCPMQATGHVSDYLPHVGKARPQPSQDHNAIPSIVFRQPLERCGMQARWLGLLLVQAVSCRLATEMPPICHARLCCHMPPTFLLFRAGVLCFNKPHALHTSGLISPAVPTIPKNTTGSVGRQSPLPLPPAHTWAS